MPSKELLDSLPEPVTVSRIGNHPPERPAFRIQMKHVVEACLRLRGPVPGVIRDLVKAAAGKIPPALATPVSVVRDGSPATQSYPSYRITLDPPVAEAIGPDIERVIGDLLFTAARQKAA